MKWWRGKNAAQTHRQYKKEKATVTHSCLICEKYHPRVRQHHGYLLDSLRENSTDENILKYPDVRRHYMQLLLDYENHLIQSDQRAKAFDRRMASWRGE